MVGYRWLVVVALAVVLAPQPAAAASSTAMTKAIAFRQEAGLNSDPVYVAEVELSAANPRTYGVALTPAEESEMARRGAISDSLIAVLPRLEADPGFGGIYIDQKAGGVVDLAVTTLGSNPVALVQGTLPSGTSLRVRRVDHSFAELSALKERVTTEMDALADEGIQVVSVAVDVPGDRVVVGVLSDSADVGAALHARYGDAIVVINSPLIPTPLTCTPTDCGNPLKGGLNIFGGGYACTSGYFQKISGTIYLVTAGHCLVDAGGTGIAWYHDSTFIGYSQWFQSAGTADAGGITTSESGAKNEFLEYVFGQHNYYSIHSLTGWTAGTSQVIGSFVCKAGATSGWTCGTLVARDVTEGNRYHLNEVSASSSEGDSGGTVVGPSDRLYGEVSLGDGAGHTWYVPPDRVNSFFGGAPCVTSTCS